MCKSFMCKSLLCFSAILGLSLLTYSASAKEFNASYQSKASLRASCLKAGGKYTNGQNSYYCNFKSGNLKECSKRVKRCIIVTRTTPPGSSSNGKVVGPAPGLLDPTPGLSPGGPSATGAPVGTGGGRAASGRLR